MRFGRNDQAVSPIIATILMVAVTIVLAGVLYVMIIGMGGGSNESLAPLGSWHDVDAVNMTSAKLVFGPFSGEVNPIDLKIILYEEDVDEITTITIQTPLTSQYDNPCSIGGHNESQITATYNDYSYSTNQINGGDFIVIDGLASGKYYKLEVFHFPSQSILSMTGDASSFQIPQ
ncbi:MAG: type IV pilin [Thermoplasmata archaeon]|nr:type IV pilin [Thermoplasmata archaeon]